MRAAAAAQIQKISFCTGHDRLRLQCIQGHIEPMRKDLLWGFNLPYMITGQLNQHPREAMKLMAQEGEKDIVAFYDSVVEEE